MLGMERAGRHRIGIGRAATKTRDRMVPKVSSLILVALEEAKEGRKRGQLGKVGG